MVKHQAKTKVETVNEDDEPTIRPIVPPFIEDSNIPEQDMVDKMITLTNKPIIC